MSTRLQDLDAGLNEVQGLTAGHGYVDAKAAIQQEPSGLDLTLRAEAGYKPSDNLDLYGQAWADIDPSTAARDFGAGAGVRWRF